MSKQRLRAVGVGGVPVDEAKLPTMETLGQRYAQLTSQLGHVIHRRDVLIPRELENLEKERVRIHKVIDATNAAAEKLNKRPPPPAPPGSEPEEEEQDAPVESARAAPEAPAVAAPQASGDNGAVDLADAPDRPFRGRV